MDYINEQAVNQTTVDSGTEEHKATAQPSYVEASSETVTASDATVSTVNAVAPIPEDTKTPVAEEKEIETKKDLPQKDGIVTDLTPDSEEVVVPPLPLPEPVSDYRSNISAFGFSQQGESHISKDIPCQDRCDVRFISDSVVIGAIADGVGSCSLSDYGAETAVASSLSYLEEHLRPKLQDPDFRMDSQFMGKLLRDMMQYAYDQVKLKAEQMQQLLYSMQSTLTVSVYDGTTLYFAHAGDDGIVAQTRDAQCAMITSRHKGEEASSVYPLQNKATWQYGKVDNAVGFVMATDGVLDAFVRNSVEENRIYYPFIEPVFSTALSNKEETAANCNDWYEYMKTPQYRSKVTDDLSFVCVINQEALKDAKKYEFDIEKWNRVSQEFAERRKAALYPPKSKQPEAKNDPPKTEHGTTPPTSNAQRQKMTGGNDPYYRNYSHGNPAQKAKPVRNIPLSPKKPHTNEQTAKLREYSKKTLEGVGGVLKGMGGILIVSTEMLVDAGEDAIRNMKERTDQNTKTGNGSVQIPNSKDKRNNGGHNGY